MTDRFDSLLSQLLEGLQAAEKQRRAAYRRAADNKEWDEADRESAMALRITNWRRTLNTLRIEMADSGLDDVKIDADIRGEPQSPENAAATQPTPAKLILFGKQHDVCNWGDLYVKVCEILLLHAPYVIAALDKDTQFNPDGQINFSYLQSEININNEAKRLSNGLWVNAINDAENSRKNCYLILEKCGFPGEELQIGLTSN